jgi:hypothetical protein
MAEDARKKVDAILAAGFASRGFADNREAFRERLRELKGTNQQAFERAVGYYAQTVTEQILSGADPVETWIEYGEMLGRLTDDGGLMSIDPTGRAWTYGPPARSDHVILFVPETGRASFVVARSETVSDAQSATIQLLVENRLALRQAG